MIDFTFINKSLNKNKKIILWGAGPNVEKFINNYVINKKIFSFPIGIIETQRKTKRGSNFLKGLPFISISDVHLLGSDNCVIIITAGLLDLYSDIVKNELYYYKIIHKKSIEYYEYYLNNKINLKKNISFLNDKESKKIYIKRLQNIIEGKFLDPALVTPQYFLNDLIISLPRNKIHNLLYAGAFNGKNIDRFLKCNPNAKIYAFEPSIKMFKYLKKKYHKNETVKIFNNLLWNSNKKLRFNDDSNNQGLSASVNNAKCLGENYLIKGYKIDELIDEFKADYIVLDVEGSELNTLRGANNYIKKHLPMLALCIYHSPGDYHKILEYMIDNFSDNYNFYIRQHSIICYIETVLYCVPK